MTLINAISSLFSWVRFHEEVTDNGPTPGVKLNEVRDNFDQDEDGRISPAHQRGSVDAHWTYDIEEIVDLEANPTTTKKSNSIFAKEKGETDIPDGHIEKVFSFLAEYPKDEGRFVLINKLERYICVCKKCDDLLKNAYVRRCPFCKAKIRPGWGYWHLKATQEDMKEYYKKFGSY